MLKPATLVLVPALAAASGCGRAPAPSSSAGGRATIVQSSVSLGDPHIVSDSTNRLSLLFSAYEPLVALDDADAERQQIYREIYRIVRDDAPWVFLYRPTNDWGVRAGLAAWAPRADGLVLLR